MALWKWRVAEDGKINNGLEEGEMGPREMSGLEMAERESHHSLIYIKVNSSLMILQLVTSNSSKLDPGQTRRSPISILDNTLISTLLLMAVPLYYI